MTDGTKEGGDLPCLSLPAAAICTIEAVPLRKSLALLSLDMFAFLPRRSVSGRETDGQSYLRVACVDYHKSTPAPPLLPPVSVALRRCCSMHATSARPHLICYHRLARSMMSYVRVSFSSRLFDSSFGRRQEGGRWKRCIRRSGR